MKLLVAIDLSEASEKIFEKAAEIAKAFSAKMWLLHVADPEPDFVGYKVGPQYIRDEQSSQYHIEHNKLQAYADKLRAEGISTTALLIQGSTAESIIREASKLDVDMIILGSHGRGAMYRLLVGSTSEGVLRKSECPVLIVPTHKRT